MTTDEWSKHANRLRELARDPNVRAYLLGRLVAESSADQLAHLVEACLVYRERFGAAGNDRDSSTSALVRHHLVDVNVARGIHDSNRGRGVDLPDL